MTEEERSYQQELYLQAQGMKNMLNVMTMVVESLGAEGYVDLVEDFHARLGVDRVEVNGAELVSMCNALTEDWDRFRDETADFR